MKILQIYNKYRSERRPGGEGGHVNYITRLMQERRNQIKLFEKSSIGIDQSTIKKGKAFFSGIYCRSAQKEIVSLLKHDMPDVVHVHNLYPLISPSVLIACHRANIPVVMTVHNYSLTCPNWYHLYKGQICELCLGGREYSCVINNCRNNILESIGYALRTAVARRFRFFHNYVDIIIALTDFNKKRLIKAGFEEERICVLPPITPLAQSPEKNADGKYIAYVGRMSPEKGVDVLLAAAGSTSLPVRLAGHGPYLSQLVQQAPNSAEFVGFLKSLETFYLGAKFFVVPSVWYEVHPIVISEAMGFGLPVIGPRIGGIPEMIEDGVTGLLFEPGNSEDLALKMKLLWNDHQLCKKMGIAAQKEAVKKNDEDLYYKRLIGIYEKAMKLKENQTSNR